MRSARFFVLSALVSIGAAACADRHDLVSPDATANRVSLAPPPFQIIPVCRIGDVACAHRFNVDISAGNGTACSLRLSGELFCWGDNSNGMVGIGASGPQSCTGVDLASHPCAVTPSAVGGTLRFSAVSVGGDHVCAIQSGSGAAFCWGANQFGQLGFSGAAVATPTLVPGGFTFATIATGGSATCGVTTAAAVLCWGNGFSSTPSAPSNIGSGPFTSVSVSDGSFCQLETSGTSCNGVNRPYKLIGAATTATHFCEITSGGGAECWGDASYGKLGNGSFKGTATSPVQVSGGLTFTAVSTAKYNTCGVSGGTAFCWGENQYSQLGTPYLGNTAAPSAVVPANANPTFTKISAGVGFTCALDNGGGVWCWGLDVQGQLGEGDSIDPRTVNDARFWGRSPGRALNP